MQPTLGICFVKCAWCDRDMGTKPVEITDDMNGATTHDCCRSCQHIHFPPFRNGGAPSVECVTLDPHWNGDGTLEDWSGSVEVWHRKDEPIHNILQLAEKEVLAFAYVYDWNVSRVGDFYSILRPEGWEQNQIP